MTGFNTEFRLDGRPYHVQTEDMGSVRPFFQTLVYVRGEIVDSFRGDYSGVLDGPGGGGPSRMMEEQHKRIVDDVKSGKRGAGADADETDSALVFGGRPLEEAILEHIREEGGIDVLELALQGPLAPRFSSPLALAVKARLCASGAPVPGAEFSVKLVSSLKKLFVLAQGRADREGGFAASVDLPPSQPGNCAILVSCASEYGNDAIEAPITV